MREIQGRFVTPTGSVALLASRFNEFIVSHLISGARDALLRHGVADEQLTLVRVPGALELALAADQLAASGRYAAVIALGCVIRGATAHFDVVVGESAKGLAQVGLRHGVPVINAVLTCDTLEQAIDRAGAKAGNKGFEAGLVAIEMLDLLAQVRS